MAGEAIAKMRTPVERSKDGGKLGMWLRRLALSHRIYPAARLRIKKMKTFGAHSEM